MIARYCTSFFIFLVASPSFAQIQTAPIEISAEAPDSSFSDRTGDWPSAEISNSELKPSARPLSETLNTIPGLQSREQGSPTLSIRGSAQADRVLKLYEGIPLNFADGLGASNFFIPEEVIGSLRLLKGPASVFFGPSAMAGALDHRTRIFERPALRLAIADDTGLLGKRSLFVAAPFKHSQLTAFAERAPQLFRFNTPSGGDRREQNGSETLRTTFNGDWRAGNARVRPILLVARQNGELSGATYSPYLSTFKMNGSLAGVETLVPLSNENDLSLRVSDLRLWREDFDANGNTNWKNSRSMASTDWRSFFTGGTLRTFIDARTDSLSASSLEEKVENAVELGQTLEYEFAARWRVLPGYRYLPKYGEVVKALGIQHSVQNSNISARGWLNYSEGFRNASLSDRFARFGTFVPNEGLAPEKSKGGELGMRFENGRRFGHFLEGYALGFTSHLTQYENLFESAHLGNGTITRRNVGRAQTKGAEFEIAFGYSVWNASVAHSYLEAENQSTGERLRLAPRNQTALTASTALGPAIFELKETIWSTTVDRDLTNAARDLPGWSSLDFNVRTIAMTDLELRAGVLNVLDTPIELTFGYPEPQRRFYASCLASF